MHLEGVRRKKYILVNMRVIIEISKLCFYVYVYILVHGCLSLYVYRSIYECVCVGIWSGGLSEWVGVH